MFDYDFKNKFIPINGSKISGLKVTIQGPLRNCVGSTAMYFNKSSGKSFTVTGSLIVKVR